MKESGTSKVKNVTVVGSGVMGAQIAQVIATSGYVVHLHDVSAGQLTSALERIQGGPFGLRAGVARGKLTAAAAEAAIARIKTTTDLQAAVREADLVVEAVPELIDLKVSLFRRLDSITPAGAVLTSNTAGLPISALAAATNRPGRVLGWHWSQPCAVMRLAEIVITKQTDPDAVKTVVEAAKQCGKNPQVINDQPLVWGFVANRINLQVRREAARIVEEGVATEDQVDAIMRDCFRWPMGPFELLRGSGLG